MPASEVAIANQALGYVGVKAFIDSLDEDSTEAEICKLHYADVRDELIQKYSFRFTRRRQVLALLDDTRTGWGYVYAVPNDCIHPERIYPGSRIVRAEQQVPFEIEDNGSGTGQVLLTDHSAPELIYRARITNPGVFPPLFSDALAWGLAARIAIPLSVKPELADRAEKKAFALEMLAAAMSSNQGVPDPEPDSKFISERL